MDFNFRFSTESTDASLKQRVEAILKKHGLEYSIDWVLGAKPFLSKHGKLAQTVQEAGKRHTGRSAELSTTGGTSDARFIIEICPEVIELGPVNASIHKLNEHIELVAARDAAAHLPRYPARPASLTLEELIRQNSETVRRRAKLHFGHGTDNAHDEAAFLVLRGLGLPFDADLSGAADPSAHRETDSAKDRGAHPGGVPAERGLARRRAFLRRPARHRAALAHRLPAEGLRIAPRRVLDLCTGSGCLAILAARAFPRARVDASDISPRRSRSRRATYGSIDSRAHPAGPARICSPGCEARYDLIVANPPYVSTRAMRALPAEYRYEPGLALGGGPATAWIRGAASSASPPTHLNPGGLLVCEVGDRQALRSSAPIRGCGCAGRSPRCSSSRLPERPALLERRPGGLERSDEHALAHARARAGHARAGTAISVSRRRATAMSLRSPRMSCSAARRLM